MNGRELFTIGYEGSTVSAVLDAIAAAGVGILIDVRALPQSRKPGFSKRQLAAELDQRGIGYVHLKGLGTPKPGRDAARAGQVATMHRIFNTHMQSEAAQADLAEARDIATAHRACLLCFERDHAACHRAIIADLIAVRTGLEIVPLDGQMLLG